MFSKLLILHEHIELRRIKYYDNCDFQEVFRRTYIDSIMRNVNSIYNQACHCVIFSWKGLSYRQNGILLLILQ